jgi:hypothetical protein
MKQGFVKALFYVKMKLIFSHVSVAPGPNARIQGRKSVFDRLASVIEELVICFVREGDITAPTSTCLPWYCWL